MDVKHVGVALLGLGVVGGGTYEILMNKRSAIRESDGVDIEVKAVLDRNLARIEELGVDKNIVAKDIDDIVNNPDISIVAEFFGGVEPARTFLLKALRAGKSIVTANKEMFSKCWRELEQVASESGAGLYFEASCVGGVPVIRALTDSMQANRITSLKGIVNGTTNYILSKMSDEGTDYEACLKEAQALGYAEANPSADVDGFDSTYKNSILSSLAYRRRVPVERITREGISGVDVKDIEYGKDLDYTLKLLAVSKNRDGKIEARVHPAFLPKTHPLALVKGSFNALFVSGDSVDDVMFYGRGAGALPTGSAIVSDIVFCARQDTHRRFPFEDADVDENAFETDYCSMYYVRFSVKAGEGILAKIASVLGKNKISIKSVLQKREDTLIVVTHGVRESVIRKALCEAEQLDGVDSICALIRVEE